MLSADLKTSVDRFTHFVDSEYLGVVRVVRLCHDKAVRLNVLGVYTTRRIGE